MGAILELLIYSTVLSFFVLTFNSLVYRKKSLFYKKSIITIMKEILLYPAKPQIVLTEIHYIFMRLTFFIFLFLLFLTPALVLFGIDIRFIGIGDYSPYEEGTPGCPMRYC